jgi:hypothetical protein
MDPNNIYALTNKELEKIESLLDQSSKAFAKLYSECSSGRILKYAVILQKTIERLEKVEQ